MFRGKGGVDPILGNEGIGRPVGVQHECGKDHGKGADEVNGFGELQEGLGWNIGFHILGLGGPKTDGMVCEAGPAFFELVMDEVFHGMFDCFFN